ncbi:mannonate dehydratase [Rhodophyticola sp. CCM32]|uniref:mannonate dehydratase n=1 Tax=Rhodophyticola sp. CCM32 TaxID=2916397 RepID=UPI00107F4CCF|nr:mannonate dehydratase [Rhodophyticola sp. CCM32]QBY00653.1 mannonate dehydratase [Rhodophyticola sp. CCM32]
MKQTWRWFGPADTISIPDIRQTGAAGIVSALHHIPPGAVWPVDEITRRKTQIAQPGGTSSGLSWDVVESLPVSEAIKTRTGPWRDHIAAYKTSLQNLAAAGPKIICYNFMPILDWTRTDLHFPLPNGGTAMRFDLTDFALFDIHLLSRAGAGDDYPAEIREQAAARLVAMTSEDKTRLLNTIVAGLPGANDSWTLEDMRTQLATYAGIDAARLRQHLVDFLTEVAPLAESLGLRLCCHPDDPPFPLLGLPRVMSNLENYRMIMDAVDTPANGITLCTGSLGVRAGFDPVRFIKALGSRIHFAHLRNTCRDGDAAHDRVSFTESDHLEGDTDMVATIRALLAEESRRKAEGREDFCLPFRPDHGHDLLDDQTRASQPGYPLIGRLKGLAELRGVMAALS